MKTLALVLLLSWLAAAQAGQKHTSLSEQQMCIVQAGRIFRSLGKAATVLGAAPVILGAWLGPAHKGR